MVIPNVVGYTLQEGLKVLAEYFEPSQIVVRECKAPGDYFQGQSDQSVKRIVRQLLKPNGHLELIVFYFNEIPSLIS
ncbi:MAG: hypothetical protein GX352_02000 [Clostridiales bacterium]|nr:hypothetical protein [Clostridiales bacterium]